MDIAGLVILLVQIGIAVHALRTGRPLWWLAVILFFPLLGALIYFLVEILPELRASRAIRGFGGDIVKSWKYTANLNQQCSTAGSKAATTGLNGPQTICCRP